MEGVSSTKVTEIHMNHKAFHLELIYGLNHAGKVFLAIPNWGTAGELVDPADRNNIQRNEEIIKRMLDDTNISEVEMSEELGELVAERIHEVETEEVPA